MPNFEMTIGVLSAALACYIWTWSILVVAVLAYLILDELFFNDQALLWKLPHPGELRIPRFSLRSLMLHVAISAVGIKLMMNGELVVESSQKALNWLDHHLAPLAALGDPFAVIVAATAISAVSLVTCFARWYCDSTRAATLILHLRWRKPR